MGLSIEGSSSWWPEEKDQAVLPEFDSYLRQSHYIDLFNQGTIPFEYSIKTSVPWIKVSEPINKIKKQQRLLVSVDWKTTPLGVHKVPIIITGPHGSTITVFAIIKNYGPSKKDHFKGFVETNGYVSIEASHYTRAVNQPSLSWQMIPGIGRTGSGMTIMPVTAKRQIPGPTCPRLGIQNACI